MMRGAGVDARRRARRRRAPRPARRGPVAARGRADAPAPLGRSAATISSTASAPAARASSSWYSSTMKSLRSSGMSTAARTAARCSSEPSKKVGSVSTEIAAAPACCVGPRDRRRVVGGPQHAARRRAPLALGDDVDRSRRATARLRSRAASGVRARAPRALERRRDGSRASRTSTMRRVAATIVAEQIGRRRASRRPRSSLRHGASSGSSVRAALRRCRSRPRPSRCRPRPTPPRPATNSAAPALSSTTSRGGPAFAGEDARDDRGVRRRVAALRARSGAAFGSPKSAGCTIERVAPRRRGTRRPSCSRSSTISSRPSAPCTTHARSDPSSSSARASSSVSSGRGTPTSCRVAPRRIGQRAEQVERGAHAELAAHRRRRAASTDETSARRRTRCPTSSGSARRPPAAPSMLTPSASSTSALPHWLDTDRLPCFATRTPQRRDDERRRATRC